MNHKYTELLTSKNIYYREGLINKELLEFDHYADEYRTIYKKSKYNFDIITKYKKLTNIIIAAFNINAEDNANFFNNISKLHKYNILDETTIVISDETLFLKAYLKSLNFSYRYVVTDISKKSTLNLIKLAAAASSPSTDLFIISFFNQQFLEYKQVKKIFNAYDSQNGKKNIIIPMLKKNYTNPVLFDRIGMNFLFEHNEKKGLTDFLKLNEDKTEFVNLDD